MALWNFCLISPQNGGSCGKDAYKLAGFLNVRFSEGGYIGFEILPWYVYKKVLKDIRVHFAFTTVLLVTIRSVITTTTRIHCVRD